MLELAGRSDVEVAEGYDAPLERPLKTAPAIHGPRGIGRASLPDPATSPSVRPAGRLIVESARERPGELTLVALGPLTNVAAAVLAEPELPRLLRRLVIMGGPHSNGAGDLTPDRNTSVDPEAAAIVYREFGRAGDPLPVAVGLDVTRKVKLRPADLASVRARAGDSPITRFLEGALGYYFDYHERRYGFRGAFMHDPFVLGATLDPGLVETRPRSVSVEPAGAATGRAGPEPAITARKPAPETPANAEVGVDGEGDRFVGRLIERLVGLEFSLR
jgi:purine nucleosidase